MRHGLAAVAVPTAAPGGGLPGRAAHAGATGARPGGLRARRGCPKRVGFPHETEDGGVVWELFVVEAPAPSPSARRDGAAGPREAEEGQAGAAVSPSPHAAQRRRPAARMPAVAPAVDAAGDDGFDRDQGDALPL